MSVKLGDAIVYLKGDEKGLDNNLASSEKKTRSWASGLSAMVAGAIGAAITVVGVKAVQGVIDVGKEMISGAMGLEGVAAGFKATVESMGESSDVMIQKLREGAAGMVKDTDLMTSFNKAAQLVSKDFAETLPEGMTYFRKVANSTGQDLDYLIDSYVTGIGRLSPMILDNLGIQVDLTAAYEQFAKENGTTVSAMSKTEQQTALNAQVMKKLAENTAELPDVLGTATQKSEAFNVKWQNFKDKIGLSLLPLFTDIIDKLSVLADQWLPVITDWLTNKAIPKIGELYNWFIKLSELSIKDFFDNFIKSLDDSISKEDEFVINSENKLRQFKEVWQETKSWYETEIAPSFVDKSKGWVVDVLKIFSDAVITSEKIWIMWGDDILRIIAWPFKFIIAYISANLEFMMAMFHAWIQIFNGDWKGAWETLKESARSGLDKILSTFGTSIDDIHMKLKSFVVGLYLIGQQWIDGLISGISSKAQDLISSVVGPVQNAIDRAKKLLGIQSPSKVFEGIGANMMLGMERGVSGAAKTPVNAIQSVVPQLTGAASGGMGGGFNVTLTAPLVITAGSQYEAERILTPIIRNIVRKEREGSY